MNIIFVFLFFCSAYISISQEIDVNPKVIAYFPNWKIYGRGYQLCQLPGDLLDKLIYSFFDPTSGECVLSDTWADIYVRGPIDAICENDLQPADDSLRGNFYQLIKLKQRFPHLKVLASVGGWTYSAAFHNYMAEEAARIKMAKSCADLIDKYSDIFDGLDVDLEYPCLPDDNDCGPGITPSNDDRGNYVAFIKSFRDYLNSSKLLTIGISANPQKIKALDFIKLNELVDSYYVFTFDFTSASFGDQITGHHTNPLFNPNDPLEKRRSLSLSAQTTTELIVSLGAQINKINVGAAFYGKGFLINKSDAPAPFVNSLGVINSGTWQTNDFDYYDMKENYFNGTNTFWDDIAKAPYIFDTNKGYFITYDDPRSIREKYKIAKHNGYEGIFAWELTGDYSFTYELLNAMRNITCLPENEAQFFAVQNNRAKYIVCTNRILYLMPCPNTTWFNPKTNDCDIYASP